MDILDPATGRAASLPQCLASRFFASFLVVSLAFSVRRSSCSHWCVGVSFTSKRPKYVLCDGAFVYL